MPDDADFPIPLHELDANDVDSTSSGPCYTPGTSLASVVDSPCPARTSRGNNIFDRARIEKTEHLTLEQLTSPTQTMSFPCQSLPRQLTTMHPALSTPKSLFPQKQHGLSPVPRDRNVRDAVQLPIQTNSPTISLTRNPQTIRSIRLSFKTLSGTPMCTCLVSKPYWKAPLFIPMQTRHCTNYTNRQKLLQNLSILQAAPWV